MSIHRLIRQQYINIPLNTVWDFFSDPANLQLITPADMNFTITSPPFTGEMYPGQIITYTVSPLWKIPLEWVTEITHVLKNKMFVDEQRKGPYKLWHHQHIFEEKGPGVLMTDIVHYQLPFSFIGTIAHSLLVKKKLDDIFEFRHNKVEQLFNQG